MSTEISDAAETVGLQAMTAVHPRLEAIVPASARVAFPTRTLLHAGPPFLTSRDIVPPILNSAAAAAVFEHWYNDLAEARAAILAGEVRMQSAQDFDCTVPLASVLSPSQRVLVVSDAQGVGRTCYAPLNGGNQWALRLGLPKNEVVEHLRWLNERLAPALAAGLNQGVDLITLADTALSQGDDCHGRTIAGTAAFAAHMANVLDETNSTLVLEYLHTSPGFFLNLWMAATKCILTAAEGLPDCLLVTSAGGNGCHYGMQVAARPGHWITVSASPPVGDILGGYGMDDALPAVGDSAVVEMLGLGAMAMWLSPQQQQNIGAFMPEPAEQLATALLVGRHPGFTEVNVKVGLSAVRVVELQKTPVVALGILDAKGGEGRIGSGIYRVPIELFERVTRELH